MDARNCPRCGKVYNHVIGYVCRECQKAEEAEFEGIKKYLEDNPLCNMQELSEGTGVSIKKIMQYMRDGRLVTSEGMKGELSCESCGKAIESGRYCDSCLIDMNNKINSLFSPDIKKSGKMHTSRRK